MGFADAVRHALSNYATFSGRARRSEYWWFSLFSALVGIAGLVVDLVLDTSFVNLLVTLALFLPGLAVSVRRLHDIGRSGWWLLIALVPLVGIILLLVWYCQDSQPQPNAHGPSPKHSPIGDAGGYPSTV